MGITFVHGLNDKSGSPRVLRDLISAVDSDYTLFVGQGDGILSTVKKANVVNYSYCRGNNVFQNLYYFLKSQMDLFVSLNVHAKNHSIIYVNTILPIGASLYGWLRGKTVIYHVHEIELRPKMFWLFLVYIMKITATKCVFVSEYCASVYNFSREKYVLYNSVDLERFEFKENHLYVGKFNILMVCSLREYKGVYTFVDLAKSLVDEEDISFTLVANATESEIHEFFVGIYLPANLTIEKSTLSPEFHYAKANVLLNLSIPNQWIESFGMTIIEAFASGIPAIGPNIGGPSELIENAVNGYLVDTCDLDDMKQKILFLKSNAPFYKRMCEAAKRSSKSFSFNSFKMGFNQILENL